MKEITLASIVDDIINKYNNKSIAREITIFPGTVTDFQAQYHSGLGRYIRNLLMLWDDASPYYKFFKDTYGLTHADDMSGLILIKLYMIYNESWIAAELDTYRKHWELMKGLDDRGTLVYEVQRDNSLKSVKISIAKETKRI